MDLYSVVGSVFDLKRDSLHDGPGIRSTVFLKGCPLHCAWCHNPESLGVHPELSYNPSQCVGCGACVKRCPQGCHTFDKDGAHLFDRTKCIECFACADTCFVDALKQIGVNRTVGDVMKELLKDLDYYKNTDGGITVSGGEPLFQPEFTRALLQACHEQGLHTAIETSGFTSEKAIMSILPYCDLFLFDYKLTDPELHKHYTGVDNAPIHRNLQKISENGAKIILRCPIIPGINDTEDHFAGIAAMAERLSGIQEVNIMAYHPYGVVKGKRVGRTGMLEELETPKQPTVDGWVRAIAAQTSKRVIQG